MYCVQHTLSTAYHDYCIHRVLHHPKIDCLLLSASLSSVGRPCCTQFSTFAQLRVNQWIEPQPLSRLPPELPPPQWPRPSTPPMSLDHCLQVHLQTHSITASMCISNLAQLRPPSSHHHSLQVHLQTCSITASECISNLTWSWSPHSLNQCLQVYLQTRSI